MTKLLYVKSSPRRIRSHSNAVADAFIGEYKKKDPTVEVMTHDLFAMDLPEMNEMAVNAKHAIMNGKTLKEDEKAAWTAVDDLIGQFQSANKYVFSVPMWNFGIPYRLKQYFDVIVQPNYTFKYSEGEGYQGLIRGRPAFVAYASGGTYGEGSPVREMDFQRPYMSQILGFMGFSDIHSVAVEPTVQEGHETALAKRDAAIEEAQGIAADF